MSNHSHTHTHIHTQETARGVSEEERDAAQVLSKLEGDMSEQLDLVLDLLNRATTPCRLAASAATAAAAAESVLLQRVGALQQQVDQKQCI